MLIPLDTGCEQKYEVSRDGSTWVDLSSYILDASIELGNVLNIGTGNTGADDTVRRMSFTIKNEAPNYFCPLIQTSTWNITGGSYSPLLWPNRYVRVKNREMQDRASLNSSILAVGDGLTVTFNLPFWPVINPALMSLKSGTAMTMGDLDGMTMAELDGMTMAELAINGSSSAYLGGFTVDNTAGTITFNDAPGDGVAVFAEWLGYWKTDSGWRKIFEGYISKVPSDDQAKNLQIQCEDKARQFKKYIKTETQYGSSSGTPVETVIQDILDDNFGVGVVTLYCPVSPGFAVLNTPAAKIGNCTVQEAIQKFAALVGWFLGYWYYDDFYEGNADSYELLFFAPPWSKSASNGNDFYLTGAEIYRQNFDIDDQDIRNDITVNFFNQATQTRDSVNVTDAISIAAHGEKPAVFEEDQLSLIDTTDEATDIANVALADMKDMPIGGRIDIPIFMRLDLFSGVVINNALVSSTDDFYAVNSLRHYFRYSGQKQARTEAILDGKVKSGLFKWLKMENKTGWPGKVINGTKVKPLTIGTDRIEDLAIETVKVAVNAVTDASTLETDNFNWLTTSTSYGDVTGSSITFSLDDTTRCFVYYSVNAEIANTGTARGYVYLDVDGTQQTGSVRCAKVTIDPAVTTIGIMTTLSFLNQIELASGSHTIKLRGKVGENFSSLAIWDGALGIILLKR